MEEIKPKRGRPRTNFRPSILSDAQVAEIKDVSPEEEAEKRARLDADAKRKRLERQKARAEKEVENIETKEALWAHNRKMLAQQELDALLEKQERVFAQVHWANSVLSGTNLPEDDHDYVSIEEGAADLFAFVREHGTVTMELVLLGQYWKTAMYAEKFQSDAPTSLFARTGLVVGFPSHKLHELEQFIARHRAATSPATTKPAGNGFTTMKCGCGSFAGEIAVPDSIAARYIELGIPYQCGRCLDLEHKSRMESTIVTRGGYTVYGRPQ